MKCSLIIPSYNEQQRIGAVIEAAAATFLVEEIIVVNDGSTDATAEVVANYLSDIPKLQLVNLEKNSGKAYAMLSGARIAKNNTLLFLDADLIGLLPEHIITIAKPVLTDSVDMCVGALRSRKFFSTAAMYLSPHLSGQRAIKRDLFLQIPNIETARMGVETIIHSYAKKHKIKFKYVLIRGVSNTHKEWKMGVMKGAAARAKMYKEIGRAYLQRSPRITQKKTGLRKLYPSPLPSLKLPIKKRTKLNIRKFFID